MSEQTPATNGGSPQGQQVTIHNIYIKDVSFESPNAPHVFQQNAQPQVQINVGLNTHRLSEDTHEVVLAITVTAKVEDKTAFLVEVQQGGVFTVNGFSQEDLGPVLGIYCPNMLFPYAREVASNLVGKGGFPQLMLQPINFEALYQQHLQQQNAAADPA